MLLGALISRLENEADAATALAATGDLVLHAEVLAVGAHYGETPAAYTAGAAGRFAAAASDADWLGLVGAVQRSEDPAGTALCHMVRWALARDAAEAQPSEEAGCSCGGAAGGCHEHA